MKDYLGLPKIDTQTVSPAPEIAVEGPETAPTSGMMDPLELNASMSF